MGASNVFGKGPPCNAIKIVAGNAESTSWLRGVCVCVVGSVRVWLGLCKCGWVCVCVVVGWLVGWLGLYVCYGGGEDGVGLCV